MSFFAPRGDELEIRRLANLDGEIYTTDYDQYVLLNGTASSDFKIGEIQKIDEANSRSGLETCITCHPTY